MRILRDGATLTHRIRVPGIDIDSLPEQEYRPNQIVEAPPIRSRAAQHDPCPESFSFQAPESYEEALAQRDVAVEELADAKASGASKRTLAAMGQKLQSIEGALSRLRDQKRAENIAANAARSGDKHRLFRDVVLERFGPDVYASLWEEVDRRRVAIGQSSTMTEVA